METRVVEIEVLGDCVVGTCGGGFSGVIRVFPVPRDGYPVTTEDACMWGTMYPGVHVETEKWGECIVQTEM